MGSSRGRHPSGHYAIGPHPVPESQHAKRSIFGPGGNARGGHTYPTGNSTGPQRSFHVVKNSSGPGMLNHFNRGLLGNGRDHTNGHYNNGPHNSGHYNNNNHGGGKDNKRGGSSGQRGGNSGQNGGSSGQKKKPAGAVRPATITAAVEMANTIR